MNPQKQKMKQFQVFYGITEATATFLINYKRRRPGDEVAQKYMQKLGVTGPR